MNLSHFWRLALAMATFAGASYADIRPGTTHWVSVTFDGSPTNDHAQTSDVSVDGRYVAFVSKARNVVPEDTDWQPDVFVRDMLLGTTERLTVRPDGGPVDRNYGYIGGPAISSDGRYVAFSTQSTDLVDPPTAGHGNVFVRDRLLGVTEIASVNDLGEYGNGLSWGPSISADGRFVAFYSDATNLGGGLAPTRRMCYVRDRLLRTTRVVSLTASGDLPNNTCNTPVISSDGRTVIFRSAATDVTPEGGPAYYSRVYARDLVANTTELVSVAMGGGTPTGECRYHGPRVVSADGRYVVFYTPAANLVPGDNNTDNDVFLRDRVAKTTTCLSAPRGGLPTGRGMTPSISADGKHVAFLTNSAALLPTRPIGWVFVVSHLDEGRNENVAVSPYGGEPNGSCGLDRTYPDAYILPAALSADGRLVVFQSEAYNLTPGPKDSNGDIFLRELGDPFPVADGRITREDYVGSSGLTSVTVRVFLDGELVETRPLVPIASSRYAVQLPPRDVVFSVKTGSRLSRARSADMSRGDVSGLDFVLPSGDIVQDDRIDLRDLNRVLVGWADLILPAPDPGADVNGDGWVNTLDLNIVLKNFGMVGEP